ncbi:Transposable element Tcb2 transposase [Labeo rohita]|uniref:Transposable element Tcb2 transposase n=1 Tax=Labeo rohita TaxID=84645 RepID=A0ABQ8LGQ6_LABRO|nr:Transposable element Tcb2 transposase [Labeo rohita]
MEKTADLTVVQKTTIDTLHKEGKTQKVTAKEAGCSQSSVSKHINREAKGRKRCDSIRSAWAKDKKDWTAAEWSKVMFSDGSKFCISFGNQGPRVWRKRGEAQNPCCLRSSVKFPQSVMVWCAMSSAGVGPLCFLRSKVNAAVYQDVLEHFMLPAADQLYGDADFIFQQDLAPAHSAKATSTWFKDHGIPVLFLIGQQTRLTLTP